MHDVHMTNAALLLKWCFLLHKSVQVTSPNAKVREYYNSQNSMLNANAEIECECWDIWY